MSGQTAGASAHPRAQSNRTQQQRTCVLWLLRQPDLPYPRSPCAGRAPNAPVDSVFTSPSHTLVLYSPWTLLSGHQYLCRGTLLHARQNSIFRMDRSSNRNFDPRRQICGPAREAVAGCIYLFRLIVRQAASCAKSELFTLAEEARSPTRTSAPKLPSLTRVKEQGSEPAGGSHLGAWRVGAVRRGTLILQGNPSERNSQCPPMRSFDARARPAVAWPS